ncbi:hypothetical protein OPKNFCMD_1840 [Methylobacterium crusticola]|uniref:DUF3990 domain-containing protein n=1 Tax=Methylobacterium crusticola TaxID=1697972 RepID=A0ABQ4QUT6_9HYPH|nr:DUF3990 domain-containing protein [Methylobacterium crusticola]GJD49110.1 hypothetical protein OPKNFCMD_1840 [Methylobacterium crusticola]
MPVWSNPVLRVYHGTDDVSAAVAPNAALGTPLSFVVTLALCRPNTDFGQGFYVTTRLHQAREWANTRVLRAPPQPGLHAVVLGFDLDRDWLAGLDSLTFVRPIRDFWNLVTDCRHGFAPHQRIPPRPAPYDVVYGPVTLWPQRLVIADCDQISFHTRRAIRGLTPVRLADRAAYTF